MLRLDKFLADAGFGTRSGVKTLLKKGSVTVNGERVTAPELKVDPESAEILVNGAPAAYREFRYFLLNKPAGYITAKEDGKAPVVMELLKKERPGLSPVGRLDLDTEGVLLITDDGELCHRLISPKYHAVKTYFAELSAPLPDYAEALFKEPMVFSDFTAAPAENFTRLSGKTALLSICEGKYHQVKRMFAKIGCPVIYLRRESFAGLTAAGLEKGEYRELSAEEVETLKKQTGLQ